MHEKELREILAQLSQDEIDAVESIIIQGDSDRAFIKRGVSLFRLRALGLIHCYDGRNIFTYYATALSVWFLVTAP